MKIPFWRERVCLFTSCLWKLQELAQMGFRCFSTASFRVGVAIGIRYLACCQSMCIPVMAQGPPDPAACTRPGCRRKRGREQRGPRTHGWRATLLGEGPLKVRVSKLERSEEEASSWIRRGGAPHIVVIQEGMINLIIQRHRMREPLKSRITSIIKEHRTRELHNDMIRSRSSDPLLGIFQYLRSLSHYKVKQSFHFLFSSATRSAGQVQSGLWNFRH